MVDHAGLSLVQEAGVAWHLDVAFAYDWEDLRVVGVVGLG